jgi:hypothetical protein
MNKVYTYESLKSLESLPIDKAFSININGITLFDIKEIEVHEMDHSFVLLRLINNGNEEVGQINIYTSQNLTIIDNTIKFDI